MSKSSLTSFSWRPGISSALHWLLCELLLSWNLHLASSCNSLYPFLRLTLLFLDPLSSTFLIYSYILEEQVLQELCERKLMGGNCFESLHIWKCLFSVLTLNCYLSGYRNLGWLLLFFRSLRALLHCLLAITTELEKSDAVLIFNLWYEIFLCSFLVAFRAFAISSVFLLFTMMSLSVRLFSSLVLRTWRILLI